MRRLEISGAVQPVYGSLGVKRLISLFPVQSVTYSTQCGPPGGLVG